MSTSEILLLGIPIILLVTIPIYSIIRERMTGSGPIRFIRAWMAGKKVDIKSTLWMPAKKDFSRKRVFKLTFANLLLNTVATALSFALLLETTPLTLSLTTGQISLILLLFFTICLTYYGNGIYVTSVVIEAYTLLEIRKLSAFKTQFVGTHLFHGPISHIFIYSGWIVVFLLLALLDLSGSKLTPIVSGMVFLAAATISGGAYGLAQIINGTAFFQVITGLIALIIFCGEMIWRPVNLWEHPIALYFLILIFTFNATLIIYSSIMRSKIGKIDWDRSGY